MLKQSLTLIQDNVSKHAEESILNERDKKGSFKIRNDSVSCLLIIFKLFVLCKSTDKQCCKGDARMGTNNNMDLGKYPKITEKGWMKGK